MELALLIYFGINSLITIIYVVLYMTYNENKLFLFKHDIIVFFGALFAGAPIVIILIIIDLISNRIKKSKKPK